MQQCSKCGLFHERYRCSAINAKCFHCGKFGHFSRVCFQKLIATKTGCNFHTETPNKKEKSEKKRERDHSRMRKFLEKRNLLRELPFSDIRNTAFLNCLHASTGLREELKCVKRQLKDIKNSTQTRLNRIELAFRASIQ